MFEVDPRRPIACRAQPTPQLGSEPPLPTTVVADGACDDREYDQAGNLYSHTSTEFDAAGRRIQATTAASDGTTVASFQYDSCGHLIASNVTNLDRPGEIILQASSEYGADGLLRSEVRVSYGQCQRSDYEYRFDETGRVKSVFDPYTCGDLDQFTYDDAGHVSEIDHFDGLLPSPPSDAAMSGTRYRYYPNGAVQEMKHSSSYGYFSDREYDPDGQLVSTTTNAGPGGTGSVTTGTWTYDSSHRIVSFDHVFDVTSCMFGYVTLDFGYDASGALLRATRTEPTTAGFPCSLGAPKVTATDYSRPSAGVTVADAKDEKGNVVVRETTTWDAKGDATSLTRAVTPAFAPLRVFQRDFSCHN